MSVALHVSGNLIAADHASVVTHVEGVSALANDSGVAIEITTAGPSVRPLISEMNSPPRIALDFHNATPRSGYQRIAVEKGSVSAIRIALFGTDHSGQPITRVVVDLVEHVKFETRAEANKFVVIASHCPVQAQLSNIGLKQKYTGRSHLLQPAQHSRQGATTNEAPVSTAVTRSSVGRSSQPRLPFVSYERGVLFIDADNSSLSDILFAISKKTGAEIEVPPSQGMLDRVATRIGPARPQEVISKLLDGSPYNYIILENSAGAVETVLLTTKEPQSHPSK